MVIHSRVELLACLGVALCSALFHQLCSLSPRLDPLSIGSVAWGLLNKVESCAASEL